MELTDILIYFSYALIGIATVAVIVLPLINSLSDPKSLLKVGMGILGLVILFFIGYSISEPTAYAKFPGLTAGVSKSVSALLIMTYILIVGGLVGIFVSMIAKLVR
ncbi:hypothetical protein [Marinigracilibium pacificum]|uniref:Uncharacterized protein n=1 Tax=Marinigracilibium pacificum TaxID=2729599 RepID=A0A848J4M1_9BACT|nr:hypothetical protein [Marinigracilibium pacificum]NMM50711.1 hypothetical protein [Marinigracilibium pacificum]